MAIRFSPDAGKPSVAVEIPLEKPLPDYDLDQMEQPTPRDIDSLLVTQGFRDLVDDARGVLVDLVAHPPRHRDAMHPMDLGFSDRAHFEVSQITGAICPADDGVYRPGLWIVLRDTKAPPNQPLHEGGLHHAREIIGELVKILSIA